MSGTIQEPLLGRDQDQGVEGPGTRAGTQTAPQRQGSAVSGSGAAVKPEANGHAAPRASSMGRAHATAAPAGPVPPSANGPASLAHAKASKGTPYIEATIEPYDYQGPQSHAAPHGTQFGAQGGSNGPLGSSMPVPGPAAYSGAATGGGRVAPPGTWPPAAAPGAWPAPMPGMHAAYYL